MTIDKDQIKLRPPLLSHLPTCEAIGTVLVFEYKTIFSLLQRARKKHQIQGSQLLPVVRELLMLKIFPSDLLATMVCLMYKNMMVNDRLLGTNTHILNHIAVDFTKSVNVRALLPYLLAHHMLTDDETYVCTSSIPPTQQTRELLQFLKQKGSKTLQKLLCCLTKETTHLGHKTVAAKLRAAMEMFDFNGKLFCPVCKKAISSNGKQLKTLSSACRTFYALC